MAKSANQKLKLLYIVRYLLEETDENHMVSTKDIINYLDQFGIKAERKSIYDDINQIMDYGYDVIKCDDRLGGYYLASRDFELAELKILVDLVQSSKFITSKKSQELIKKLESLASRHEAKQLQRQVVVSERNKAINESILYNVDILHRAMAQNEKVSFQYFEWDINKKMNLRKNGDYYQVSPWVMTWDDEKYYLMAYDEAAEIIKYYRVDKMTNLSIMDEIRKGKAKADKIDVARISKKNFGMFSGDEVTVQLKCKLDSVGILVDRFGTDLPLRKLDEEYALARVNVAVSKQFWGWLTGVGDAVTIYGPEEIKDQYVAYLKEMIRFNA